MKYENDFSQASYLRHLDLRIVNVDNFLLSSAPQFDSSVMPSMENESQSQELTLLQIQRIIENEHMTKEREREVIFECFPILLNLNYRY